MGVNDKDVIISNICCRQRSKMEKLLISIRHSHMLIQSTYFCLSGIRYYGSSSTSMARLGVNQNFPLLEQSQIWRQNNKKNDWWTFRFGSVWRGRTVYYYYGTIKYQPTKSGRKHEETLEIGLTSNYTRLGGCTIREHWDHDLLMHFWHETFVFRSNCCHFYHTHFTIWLFSVLCVLSLLVVGALLGKKVR